MPYRSDGMVGGGLQGALSSILKANQALADRVKKLEGIVSSGTTPADTRFESQLDEVTNALTVYLRRVSTGDRLGLTTGTAPVSLTEAQIASIVAQVVALVPVPDPVVIPVDGGGGGVIAPAGGLPAAEHRTSIGSSMIDVGSILFQVQSHWGMTSAGDVYYDETGPAPGEEALMSYDHANGSVSWLPLSDLTADPPPPGTFDVTFIDGGTP